MISSTRPAASANSTAAAPATPAGAGEAVIPFDNILSVETLAASASALETCVATLADTGTGVGLDACLEGLEGLEDSASAELDETPGDSDSEESEEIDSAGPLAFLAGLLQATTPVAHMPAGGGSGGGGGAELNAGVEDALSGHAKSAIPVSEGSVSSQAQVQAQTGAGVGDAPSPDKLLAGAQAAAAPGGAVTPAEADSSGEANTAAISRAAEWLAHGPRHAAAAVEQDGIATPARDPRWAQEFSARVALMVRGGESSASLQMSPAELGPLDVNVTVRDSQATIHFGAAHADTRALIEASIPRLREMLAAQGFNLMDASVSQGFARQSRAIAPISPNRGAEPEGEAATVTRVSVNGLLDLYA